MRALARARLLVRTWGGGGMGAGAKARDGVPGGVGGIGCGQADAAGLRAGDGRGAGIKACGGGGERMADGVCGGGMRGRAGRVGSEGGEGVLPVIH